MESWTQELERIVWKDDKSMTEQKIATNTNVKVVNIEKRSYAGIIWNQFIHNRTAVISTFAIIGLILIAIFYPMLSPYHYTMLDYTQLRAKPSPQHWLGCDEAGRDMATLLAYSLRNALLIGLGAAVIETVIGLLVGATAGYFGGRVDNILMRVVDIMFGLPTFLFNIMLVLVLGRSLTTIFIAIGVTSWAGMARLVRGQVLSLKQSDYVEAGRAIGASNWRIITRYIIPNTLGPLIVSLSFSVPAAMYAESGMSLLGLGVIPPMPSWGGLIQSGNAFILSAPHRILYPALSFAITILAFSYLGDGLAEALDPKNIK
jgi:ABC-type dipeptide/oligopeptide/nickel transport systems, permease components